MGLLDKFAAVQIQADQRIAEEDRVFCQQQQDAFDKSAPALERIAEAIIAAKMEQQEILAVGEDEFYKTYLTHDRFDCDERNVYDAMKRRNKKLINRIVEYFARKYNVNLDSQEIMEHLIPVAPKEPELPWGGYRNMTDEQVDAFKEKLAAYKVEQQAYEEKIQHLPLRYEQIVDEIFVQLGGFSFQERAMNEFLRKCWDASHTQRWNEDHPTENFEIKNDTLKLTGYWCRCRDDSWRSYPEWESSDSLKTILHALVHFNIGQLNRGAEWFPELFKYDTRWNEFEIDSLTSIKRVKLFKNGRVDIKFANSTYVQEFVAQYLRVNVGGSNR